MGDAVTICCGASDGTSATDVTWQYISRNGGRTWRFDETVGGF